MVRMLTIREFRNTPATLWKTLKRDGAAALSANGVPKAVVFGIEDGDLEELVQLVTQVRAQRALAVMRQKATRRGVHRMTMDEIDAEIAAARRAKT